MDSAGSSPEMFSSLSSSQCHVVQQSELQKTKGCPLYDSRGFWVGFRKSDMVRKIKSFCHDLDSTAPTR